MAADSAEPPAREEPHGSGRSSGSGGEQRRQPDARKPSERFGELSILRTSKDDGRALIIYSHDEHEGHEEPGERERT
jgi:hypothetical protein